MSLRSGGRAARPRRAALRRGLWSRVLLGAPLAVLAVVFALDRVEAQPVDAPSRAWPDGGPWTPQTRAPLDEQVVILHFGDSHIAGDSFTRGVRRRLQSVFGDAGRGQIIPAGAFRWARADGVTLSTEGDWTAFNSLSGDPGPYSISGFRVESADPGAALFLQADAPFDWAEVTFIGDGGSGRARISLSDRLVERAEGAAGDENGDGPIGAPDTPLGAALYSTASADGEPIQTTIRLYGPARVLTVRPAGDAPIRLSHWGVGRDRPGLRYLNFGVSGASVRLTNRWRDAFVRQEIARLRPRYVVFGYGTNEGFDMNLDLDRWRRDYRRFIGLVREAASGVRLVFIAPMNGVRPLRAAAEAHLEEGADPECVEALGVSHWDYPSLAAAADPRLAARHEPPKLGAVRAAVAALAEETGSALWDWHAAMGGPCAVDAWARRDPPLAARDRIHLTTLGYDKSAEQFAHFLIGLLLSDPAIQR